MKRELKVRILLTGSLAKESRMFCWHFMEVISTFLEISDLDDNTILKLHSLAYTAMKLRDCVSVFTRVTLTEQDIKDLKENAQLYFNACIIFGNTSACPNTQWTIGYAIPYYTEKLYKETGYGLGLNTTQGREAKHTKLAKFAENAIKSQRWEQVMKHDFISNVWLREQQAKASTQASTKDGTSKVQYIPLRCLNDPKYCHCGLSKAVSEAKCTICSSGLMIEIDKSCTSRQLSPQIKNKIRY